MLDVGCSRRLFLYLVGCLCLAFLTSAFAGERFGDVMVTPISVVSGETHHGYREYRIGLENLSLKDAHVVTLVYPDQSYPYGNSISRLSRSVSVGPGAHVVLPLWQPPLPAGGNNSLRVLIDSDNLGAVNVPDAARHVSQSGYGYRGSQPATILVSRSLNFDDVNRALKGRNSMAAFSPQMATGAPDNSSAGSMPTGWTPEGSYAGSHWLELDYNPPFVATEVRVHAGIPLPSSGEILLIGVSGTNLARIPITVTGSRGGAPAQVRDFTFPQTVEPVKTVRLEFGSVWAGSINIDAVELVGPTNHAWAADARASSQQSSSSGYSYSGSPADQREVLRAELPMSEWSEYWISYTPFDAIVLSGADWRQMPPAAAGALWRYVECGGNLFVLGGGDVPEPWRSLAKPDRNSGNRCDAGFGACFILPQESLSGVDSGVIGALTKAVEGSARYWQSLPEEEGANAAFPVVENYKVPIRGTVLIMLIFVILIGPVNLIVLSRLNRRTWLLWTVPAISLATCVVVFAYSLIREGVTPDVRIGGLTLLDQANRRAASVGMTAFYCPLTPSQGLFFSFDTEATPLVETWNYRGGSRREIDWTQAQHLQRGWLMARVPAHFQLRKSETRRERLQLEVANGQVALINGLGATVRSVWIADRSGRVYAATNVAAGQKAILSPTGDTKSAFGSHPSAFFEKLGYTQPADLAAAGPVAYLLPNTYIAELDGNPFFENGLGSKAGATRTRAGSVVYGIMEAGDTISP